MRRDQHMAKLCGPRMWWGERFSIMQTMNNMAAI
jgi:hypothetical protein